MEENSVSIKEQPNILVVDDPNILDSLIFDRLPLAVTSRSL